MKCPFCFEPDSIVKDSRNNKEGTCIRRRRYCCKCSGKFTTFERIQVREILVIKRSGAKKPFDRDKVEHSITTALRKRNVAEDKVTNLINAIVLELESNTAKEIPSRKIGELIMEKLAEIDQVAYIRFASVYKDFTSAKDFSKFVSRLK